jgi:hypothetical protein
MQHILRKAQGERIVFVIHGAPYRMVGLDPLVLHARQVGQAAPFADCYEIATCRLAVVVALRFDNRVLKWAMRLNARSERLDVLLAMRDLPNVPR